MSAPHILVLGRRLPPLARIGEVGAVLGLTRSSAYRACAEWPLTGAATSRRVVVPRLFEGLGIPYEVVDEGSSDDGE